MKNKKLFIVANSHIDPVWLWNRSSGRCSWNTTIGSVVRMLADYPELKFTCSSSAMYRWIEETDPNLFADIRQLVNEKRWELVGGWEVESDTIISRPQTLIKQAEFGKGYFMDRFGVDVRMGYNVDAFGHAAGLPSILAECGFDSYVYCRSQDTPPVFKWVAESGQSVTALHLEGYGTAAGMDRDSFIQRTVNRFEGNSDHPLLFIGVGDHGGGLFRHHMDWLKGSGVPLQFGTLEEYLATFNEDDLPVIRGELGPVFRGCYSACHEVKRKVALSHRRLNMAESLGVSGEELAPAWQELLFHHFHDILPGTSVREAYVRDVFPGLGMVEHTANRIIDREMDRRNAAADTTFMTEGGVQVWNPHPVETKGIVSFDGFSDPNNTGTDYNVLCSANGAEIPLQLLPSATSYGPCGDGWGRLTAVVTLPPMSETYLAYGRSETSTSAIGVERQEALLERLSFDVCDDSTRPWGFGLTAFDRVLGPATLCNVNRCVDGPVCSILRADYRYNHSFITMDLVAYAGIDEIEIRLRMDWQETHCSLKLALDDRFNDVMFSTGGCACIDARQKGATGGGRQWVGGKNAPVPKNSGECAMIDWCAMSTGNQHEGFYANDVHSCDYCQGRLRMTLLRPALYADHAPFTPNTDSGWMDTGRSEITLWHFNHADTVLEHIPHLAGLRLQNAETHEVTLHTAGKPYAPRCPSVETSSPAVAVNISHSTVSAFNYAPREESVVINGNAHRLAPKSLKIINHGTSKAGHRGHVSSFFI